MSCCPGLLRGAWIQHRAGLGIADERVSRHAEGHDPQHQGAEPVGLS